MTTPARAALVALALLALAACAGSSKTVPTIADMKVVAQDQRFALVRLQRGQDLADLATAYFGDPLQAWQLREVNADPEARAGRIVAVPLAPVNPTSVYPEGYRVLPILCYHQFTRQQQAAHRLELPGGVFEQQLRYLLDNDYQLLSFADVAAILRAGEPVPEKAVVITIDDGYESVYEVAWPILRQYGARATLFIYTDFIGAGKGLSWNQIQEMAASGLIEIQSHAKSHTSLSRLPEDTSEAGYVARLQDELQGSEAVFQRQLGDRPVYLSYPYGNSSDTIVELLRDGGYSLAATVTRGDNTTFADAYLLHRTMIYDDHDMGDFARMLRTFRSKPLK